MRQASRRYIFPIFKTLDNENITGLHRLGLYTRLTAGLGQEKLQQRGSEAEYTRHAGQALHPTRATLQTDADLHPCALGNSCS